MPTPITRCRSKISTNSAPCWPPGRIWRSGRGAAAPPSKPLYRRVGSVGFRWFMHAVVGLAGIQDTQCGFKFFQHAVAKELFRRQKIDGYMFDVEILAIALRLRYRIEQLPIRWRDDADSRLNLVSGNLRNVRDIFRIGLEHRYGGRLL
jgi:dolichyl-phosphate beta-glucosyltransferase